MLIKINGKKLKKLRGKRSLAQVAEASGGAFTDAALLNWENETRNPKEESIKALMRVYECSVDDISEPFEWEVV